MLTLVLAVVSMMARDCCYEFLTIAQTRGRSLLAAILSPLSTLTGFAVTIVGVGPVIQHGLTPHSAAVLGVILVTDVVDGYVFTALGRRIGTADPSKSLSSGVADRSLTVSVAALGVRVDRLERAKGSR